jgi:CBS domain-containing protein/sporulation protein YlmC with PRC-barrel domain
MATSVSAQPRFFFISELIHDQVIQQPRHVLGTLGDLEIRLEGRYPEVVNLIVQRPFGRPPLVVPFSMVQSIDTHRTVVDVPAGTTLNEYRQEPERILIKDMILDKRIIDTDEYEVEVVYDIHLLSTERRLFVVHVDVSNAGLLRRLHFGWLARLLYGDLKQLKLLPWRYVQPLPSDLGRFQGDVKLNISREKIADIHPADLADIMEELSGAERMAVFNTLDTETAADALEETEPRVQRQLVASVRRERIVELLQTMTPAQIADILEILPRPEADSLLASLPPETGAQVSDLLSRHEVRLSSLATRFYLALPETATVSDALAKFRDRRRRFDVVMYVYVVNEEGILKGVVDIRELIQADPAATLASIMTEQVVTLSPHDTLAIAAREFTKYGFRALPMKDDNGKLIGAVRNKDLLAVED